MRNLILIVSLVAFTLVSCDKTNETMVQLHNEEKNAAIVAAKKLSERHDFFVKEILSNMDHLQIQKAKALDNSKERTMEVIFDAIEITTGIRPVILSECALANGIAKLKEIDKQVIDLDRSDFSLSAFNTSSNLDNGLKKVDKIIREETPSVEEKIDRLEQIQEEMFDDATVSLTDYTKFLNSTEVLKGSIQFWNEYAETQEQSGKNPNSNNEQNPTNAMEKWSFLAKLAFVASADAVGAVIGCFLGGYLTVNGIPIYIPAGPEGSVVSLAVLSVIAANMVGW